MEDLILFNGKIHTMERDTPPAEALAISDGRIAAVGGNKDVLALSKRGWRKLDLAGRTVIPGLIDSHIHFLGFALSLKQVNLDGLTSLRACVGEIKKRVRGTPPGEWIIDRGWNYNSWPEDRLPTKRDLDPISPNNPVALSSKDGHLLWVNSRALALARIDRDTCDSSGGEIGRDPSGDLTGLLKENAGALIWKTVPEPPDEVCLKALRKALRIANRLGLTGGHVPEGDAAFRGFQTLLKSGELTMRVLMMIPSVSLYEAIKLGLRSGFGNEYLRLGPVKLLADGALGGQTAAMCEPYDGDPSNMGILTMAEGELREVVSQASRAGINVAIHAIGDRANRIALNALEASHEVIRRGGLRPRIEHAQLLREEDFGRLSELNVIASMQPIHAPSDSPIAERRWGKRCRWAYAWRSVLDAGGRLAFGSDSPVETLDPLKGIYAAVTRTDEEGKPVGGWYPEQCLSVEEAVRAYTLGPAFASGEEKLRGSIKVGKWADLVVLSEDIFTEPPEKILETEVEMTVVGGEIVYQSI